MGNGPATDPYKRPFETILDGALILDATTARILLANKAAAEMFGFASPEDMVGLNPLDYIPGEDRDFVAVLLAQGLEMDRPAPAEIRVRTKDGRVIWGSVTSALTQHEGRKATLITIREITSEKAKESALREAEQQYKSLFDGMFDGAAVLDTATSRVVLANQAAARMFGFLSPVEMAGQNPLDYIPEEERERAARLVADGIERGHLAPTEVRVRSKDGRLLWVSVGASVIEHLGKKATLITARDVTSEKEKEAALREAEHRYERLFDGMLDGAVVLDISTFEIVLANKAAAEMIGFDSPREALGTNPLSFIPEEDRDEVARMIALNLEGKGQNPAEIRLIGRDKREIWVSATATRIEYEGRTATLATLRDITADKVKDAALRASEESRLRLMDAASEAISMVQDGKLVYVNQALATGAGISPHQLIGLPFLDLVHPDERQTISERYERIMAGEWPSGILTTRGIGPNGQTLWAEIKEMPFTWQGRPAVMSLIHDVTDRVRAEENRKEKEERLRTIVENAWDGISIFDEDFRVQFESPSIARMTGYTPEEWTGSRPEAFNVHPDDLPSLVSTLESLKSQPGAVVRDFKIRYRHRDGSWRWIEATGQNLLHDPRVKGIVVNFRDITDSVKAEEAMKASEERFRTLIEKATDVVIVLDASGKITYQSPSLERVTGFGHNEWLNKPLGELLIHPDDMPALAALLQRILTQPGATVEGVTARYQHKDGSWHTLEATVTNMLHDPKVNGLVANFRDISDRKTAEEALKRSETLLRDTQQLAAIGGWEYDVEIKQAVWTDETYRIHEIPKIPTIDHIAESLKCYPPPDRQTIALAFQKCLEEGVPYDLELPFVTFTGKQRWVRTSAKAIREGDRIVRVLGNIADITERKRMEDALRSSEEGNRTIVENANEAITIIQDGVIKFVNPKFSVATGYAADEVLLKSFLEIVHPDDRQRLADYYVRRQKGEDVPNTYQFRFLDKAGNTKWAETNAALFEWEGRPAALGLMSDITERKRAEETLQESEERFRLLTEMTNDIIWMTDMNLRTTYISPSAERLLGFRPEELLGSAPESQMTPESVARAAETLLKQLEMEQDPMADPRRSATLELEYYRKDGSTVWMENRVGGIRDANGRLIGFHGVARDATERKRAEEALKDSEAKYKRLFESTQTAMEVISMETGLVVLANEATARMFGFASANDLVGEDSMKYLRPEDIGWVSTKMARAVADNTWQEIAELQVRTRDGRWLWISGMAIQSEYQGNPALLVSLVNITSRKQAELTLQESEQKYRLLTEKTNDIIYTTDLDFNDTYVSPSVERILGFTPEEYLGRSPDQRMTLESLAHAQQALLEHLSLEKDPKADPNRTVRIELEFYRKDGPTVWLEHQVSAMRDASGTAIGLHGVARDVTERRKAQKALRDSEAIYKRLFENTQTAMEVVSGETGLVVLANETTARMFGFDSAEDLVGVDSMEYLAPEDRDRVATEMAQALANKDRGGATELSVRTRDGRWLWINALVTYTEYEGKTSLLISLIDLTSRKLAEEKLKASEEKYRLLAEKTNDVIWTADLNLRTTYVSPSVQRVLGFTVEERLRQGAAQQMTPDSFDQAADALAHHLALEQDPTADPNRTLRIELEYYRKDGSTVWLENQVTGLRDASGTLVGFHGVGRDISERRRAEQALRASEEKYRLVAESTNDEIWTSDINLNTTYVSPSVEKLLGFTVEERMKQDVMAQMTPESFAQAAEMLKHHLALEEDPKADPNRVLRIELEYYRKDGSTVWLENQVGGIRDASGKLIGFHGVARDVTERRRAEKALNERLKELQCIASISRLAEKPMVPVEDFVREAVSLLPPAWQYPDICAARITMDSKEFKTANYRHTEWSQSADIRVDEKRFGTVTVCYLEEMPGADEGPFLREERDLINTVADFLGHVIQHRQMEQSLRTSEERFRTLIEKSTDAIAILDASGMLLYESPSMERITGYKLQDWLGKPVGDWLLHPDDLAAMASLLERLLTHPEVTSEEVSVRFKHKDGTWHYLEGTVRNLLSDPKVNGLVINYRDVTERVKAQEALASSENKYRDLFDHTLLGMEVVDLQTGTTVLANRSLARMFGFKSPADMIGTNPLDYVLPEDKEWVATRIAQVLADPSWDEKIDIRARTEDGRLIWCSGIGTPFGYEGKPRMLISLVEVTAAKEAEFKLIESEEKNRLLIDNAAEGIIVVQDGVTRFFNRRCTEVTGRSSEELLAGSFLDLVHPEDREMVALNYMKRVAGEDIPNNYQFRIIDKEGNTRWLQVNGVRLNWEGKPATLTMLSDVTERVKAQQALKESEERYRLLAENASDIIWIADLNLRLTYTSPAASKLLGYTAKDLAGGAFLNKALTPDSLASMAQLFTNDLAAEDSRPGSWKERVVEIEVVSKDGSKLWLEAAINSIRDPDGRLVGFQGACRDITQRKRAEALLRNSEERFRGLVETTSDWVWEMDRNSRYTYVSPKVRDVLGYEPEELLGHTPYEFMHQRESRRVSKIVRRFSTEHLPFSLLENTCAHKDGHQVVLETSAVPIIGNDGSFLGYRGIDRDITERKKVEQELQRSLKRLEKTMESTIEAITTTIETRDPYTTGHQMRVTDLACAIAKVMEVPPTQIEGIRVAGLLHDIGKIAIPTEILSKPGKLNEVEYEMIKTHSKVGYNILKKIEFPWPVARTVLQHHERWDGSGYPHGIRGEDILLEARILAVADVMEAMSSHRPYRPSIGADRALDEISQNRGIKYDPAVADACITAFTQNGFKFAPSMPGGAAEPETTSLSHPVEYLEEH